MIQASDLSFAYPGAPPALREVSFSLARGRTLCVAGANGSGKSTLLSLLAGLYRPTSGRIELAGFASPGQEKLLREAAGLVLQDADLQILGSTPAEDLTLGFAPDDSQGRERAMKMAGRFGLEAVLSEPVESLSFGQKRKLCLAVVLARGARVVLMDEPLSNLDYPATIEFRRVLAMNKAEGVTQVVAAHDLDPLADLVDGWLVLDKGRAVLAGEAGEVMDGLREHGVRPPSSWLSGRTLTPWE